MRGAAERWLSVLAAANLLALPDSRPGKDRRFHREIAAGTLLRTEVPDFEIHGVSRFFLVRGDSADWPAGIPHSGLDSTLWFIETWEDEAGNGPPSARLENPLLTQPATWGRLKALYLRSRPAALSLRP